MLGLGCPKQAFAKIATPRISKNLVLSQKENVCVKINCKLFSCDKTVDSHGDTFDFMLSEHRDEEAATAFFKQTM
ncbi:DDE-type integrase/transposase/recombinase [Bathymodiolus platifrons methanotrophic gill symbiont]|uniref:DDE-type integrase/transposase/recombinase n=1 Tax=Bathymodiolus platifrons methanotrophic gill symbiont TaxID=113268 RepID=UPI000B418E43|nr:DDE-type integrase/transposase/recombinase [Bathymodiolus platifrons methanotrophic gill symbiont]